MRIPPTHENININVQAAGCEDMNYAYLQMAQDSIRWKIFIHSVMSLPVSGRSEILEHKKDYQLKPY
jgi:hypothetical protein